MLTLRLTFIWLLCIVSIFASSSVSGNGYGGNHKKNKHGNDYDDSKEYKLMTTIDSDHDKSTTTKYSDKSTTTKYGDRSTTKDDGGGRSTTRDRPDFPFTTDDSIDFPFTTDEERETTRRTQPTPPRTTRDEVINTEIPPFPSTTTEEISTTTDEVSTTEFEVVTNATIDCEEIEGPIPTQPCRCLDGETCQAIEEGGGRCVYDEVNEDCEDARADPDGGGDGADLPLPESTRNGIFDPFSSTADVCGGSTATVPCFCFGTTTCLAIQDGGGRCVYDTDNEICVDARSADIAMIGSDTVDVVGTTKNGVLMMVGFVLCVVVIIAICAFIWWYCKTLKPSSHESVAMNDESESEEIEYVVKTNVIDSDDEEVEVLVNDGEQMQGTGYTY